MNSSWGRRLKQGALLALVLAVWGYWGWQRYQRPLPRTYEGKTLEQWIVDLGYSDCQVSHRAAAALIRTGAPAAPELAAALSDKAKEKRIEVVLVRLGSSAVPALLEALADETRCEEAAHVLGLIGPRAADAVPDLLAVLDRRQAPAALRSEAAFALGRIGEPIAAIVPALSAALQDGKMEVREQAAESLGWIGPPAREAMAFLAAAVNDEEPKVARRACQALSFIDEKGAATALLKAFESERTQVAIEAGRALWRLGPKAESIVPALLSAAQGPIDKSASARTLLASFGPWVAPTLVAALNDNEAARREAAADILGRIGPPARAAVPALLVLLKDKSSAVAFRAAMALSQIDSTRAAAAVPLLSDALDDPGAAAALANIGPDARAAVPALIAALKPRKGVAHQEALRAGARLALARIGTPAVSALIEVLKDKRDGVAQRAAGDALGWVLPPSKEAVPALIQALKNDRVHAGVYAHALGQLGPLAFAAVPDLTDLLTDPGNRPASAVALVRIDPGQAAKVVPLLVKDLQAAEENQRLAAVLALTVIGPAAKEAAPALVDALRDRQLSAAALIALPALGAAAVPNLIELLKSPQADHRLLALQVLAKIGAEASAALLPAIASLLDADSAVRVWAAVVIQAIGPDARAAVPILIANLRSLRPEVRSAAAAALGHIGPDAKEARQLLLECLLDAEEDVRYAAALSLGRIDPRFAEAVPALRDALSDSSPMVRLAALDSLSRIEPRAARDNEAILVALCRKPYPLEVRFRAVAGLTEALHSEQAKQAVPWLLLELTDDDTQVRLYAGRLLAAIDPGQITTIALALAAALGTPLPDHRRAVLQTLGEFGPKARAVVPEVERLLYDGSLGVREEAIRALRAINPARGKQLGVD
ncbi:MAG: HEAT repeat domain-containing protein [Gemmataceae bacterium]